MIGEALTTRLKLTFHLRLQFLRADLDYIDTGTAKGQDETSSIHPRDLRPPALRDQATTVAVDRRRHAQLAGELIRRRRRSHDILRQLDRDGRHFVTLLSVDYYNRRSISQPSSYPDPVTKQCSLPVRIPSSCPGFAWNILMDR